MERAVATLCLFDEDNGVTFYLSLQNLFNLWVSNFTDIILSMLFQDRIEQNLYLLVF